VDVVPDPASGPPDPGEARTLDELVQRLRLLKVWSGDPSYVVIKDRVNAAARGSRRLAGEQVGKSTVADCFKLGRRRVNTDLVVAVVAALHPDAGYAAQWRQMLRVVLGETRAADQVRAQDTLPGDIAEFTGRGAELERLLDAGASTGDGPVIAVIEGMAGIGKTQLAIRAAHLLDRRNPFDQLLFVSLRGFHPDQPPADPGAVLDSFLRLMGMPVHEIPHDLPARVAAFHRMLAGRRALIVLDDAASEEQVELLVPRSAGCVALITSRRSLPALRPAVQLPVGVFTAEEALAFVVRSAPSMPPGDDPDALLRLAHRCGYLPLALSLVAGHMRAKPGWTLTDHADWLDDRHGDQRLDTGIELALSLSYEHLPAGRRRVFRLLAVYPGYDVNSWAAAALTELDVHTAGEHLEQLSKAHLLQQTTPGRYSFHDLVRIYAAGRARDEDPAPARRAAVARLLGYHLATSSIAMDVLEPDGRHTRPRASAASTPVPPLTGAQTARKWLCGERVNLIAAASYAADHGWPEHNARMAAVLFRYLDSGDRDDDAVAVHPHVRPAGGADSGAYALTSLGAGHLRQGRYEEAAGHFHRALRLFRGVGDQAGEAQMLGNLGHGSERLGHSREAIDQHGQARTLFRGISDRFGEAQALTSLGVVSARLGRYQLARDYHRQALALFRDIGDRAGEAVTLNNLGETLLAEGKPGESQQQHNLALGLAGEIGDRYQQARAHDGLAHAQQASGNAARARRHWQHALTLYALLGAPEAGRVRAAITARDDA